MLGITPTESIVFVDNKERLLLLSAALGGVDAYCPERLK